MGIDRGAGTLLTGAVVLAVVAMLAGQALGQPVLVAYVTTDSMEPTMAPGDGFLVVPAAVSGPVEEGDVVVYRAETLHGGGLTTHRVVAETDRGYVTRGDANAVTDQDAGEPPVGDEQVVATAVQVGGGPVVVPHLGTAVTAVSGAFADAQGYVAAATGIGAFAGPQGVGYLLFALALVAYAVDVLRGRGRRRRHRSRSRSSGLDARLLVGAMAALVVLSATASMVVPSGATAFDIYSTDREADRPDYVQQGHAKDNEIAVHNGGVVPVVVFFEPGDPWTDVRPREAYVDGRGQVRVTATFAAPRETGYYRRYVVEHRYLAILPRSVLRALYGVHPWVPVVVIDALVGVPVYLLGTALLGTGRVRDRSRAARTSATRLKRVLTGSSPDADVE